MKNESNSSLPELKKTFDELVSHYHEHFDHDRPKSDYQRAARSMLLRAKSIAGSVWLEIDNKKIVESGILTRSLLNLYWNFRFMVDAKQLPNGQTKFEDNPGGESKQMLRARRYLSWHWADAYKSGIRTDKVVRMFEELKKTFGYREDKDVPSRWYQEPGINRISDIAREVGAEAQYTQDYSHLSSLEHSDITASVVDNFIRKGDSGYADFVSLKANQFFGHMLEITAFICGRQPGRRLMGTIERLEEQSKSMYKQLNEFKSEPPAGC